MASSSEISSGPSMNKNSGSEEGSQTATVDQRRRKRISILGSIRRNRMRKQKHLDDLAAQVTQLKKENHHIFTSFNLITKKYLEVEAENTLLRAKLSELSSTISDKRMYEVFLSFREEDTSASFISHLCASLQTAGIIVFKDDESLPKGHHLSDSLLQAIQLTQISVVVLSRNYADSLWCLQELEKIMECHRTMKQLVVPVFCGVDPSEVHHQIGEFGKAFENLSNQISREEDNKVQRWREALSEAANISGIVVLNSWNESEAVKCIVEHVTCLLDKIELPIVENPVGAESQVQDMI